MDNWLDERQQYAFGAKKFECTVNFLNSTVTGWRRQFFHFTTPWKNTSGGVLCPEWVPMNIGACPVVDIKTVMRLEHMTSRSWELSLFSCEKALRRPNCYLHNIMGWYTEDGSRFFSEVQSNWTRDNKYSRSCYNFFPILPPQVWLLWKTERSWNLHSWIKM